MRPISRATVVLPVPGLPKNTLCRFAFTTGRFCCRRNTCIRAKFVARCTSAFTGAMPTNASNSLKMAAKSSSLTPGSAARTVKSTLYCRETSVNCAVITAVRRRPASDISRSMFASVSASVCNVCRTYSIVTGCHPRSSAWLVNSRKISSSPYLSTGCNIPSTRSIARRPDLSNHFAKTSVFPLLAA